MESVYIPSTVDLTLYLCTFCLTEAKTCFMKNAQFLSLPVVTATVQGFLFSAICIETQTYGLAMECKRYEPGSRRLESVKYSSLF